MLEKTFTKFYASNVLLQWQYREHGFTKYFESISCLLVAKQNNEFLMRNHQSRSTESESFLEVNAISSQTCGQGREWGHGKNPQYHGSYSNNSSNSHKRKVHCTTRSGINIKAKQENGKCMQDKPPKSHENNCYRCGMKRHWSCTCRTPKHLVDLYQVSIKAKGK